MIYAKMKEININCDVGEGVNNEAQLMPFIQNCSIACGGHTGNEESMKNVVELALKYNVKIGAHPSYPDRENFGRKSMKIESNKLIESIQSQVKSLEKVVLECKGKLHHIKPHGALYNDIAKNKLLAQQFLKAILPYKSRVNLFVPYNSEIEKCALNNGFSIIYEAFADRNYNDDLSLVSRTDKEAVIFNSEAILRRVLEILNAEKVVAISGEKIAIKAETFCVHSDTKSAVEIVKKIANSRIIFED